MHVLLRTAIAAVAGVLFSTPAFAVRAEFIATSNGIRIAGAEICFFRAGEGPSSREIYLSSGEVRCLPADDVLDLPKGRWAYFARHESGYVNFDASVATVFGENPKVDDYGTVEVVMARAGRLDLSAVKRMPDDWLALYVSNENGRSSPMLAPVGHDADAVLIPADVAVQVLVMRTNRLVDVSQPVSVGAGERGAPVFAERDDARATVVAWVTFAAAARKPGDHWGRLPAPNASLMHGTLVLHPELALRPGYGADGAMLVFRSVPTGASALRLGGDLWVAAKQEIAVLGGDVLSVPVLEIAPGASLDVRWTTGTAPPVVTDDCAGVSAKTPEKPAAFLYTCSGMTADTSSDAVDPRQCKRAWAPVNIDEIERLVSFRGVAPGTYLLGVRDGAFPEHVQTVTLAEAEQATRDATLETFIVHGTLKLDGKPLRARLEFLTGNAASDATGSYYANLEKSPRDLPIGIFDCGDGTLIQTHLPVAHLHANQQYDIELTQTRLHISVVDGPSKAPIAGAAVEVAVTGEGSGDHFVGGPLSTNRDGKVTALTVPRDRKLGVCAKSEAHERTCTPDFDFGTEGSITVRLARKGQYRGRLVANPQPEVAWVFFVDPQGTVLEQIRVAPDGTFQFRMPYQAPSYVVVSSTLPLFVVPLPPSVPLEILELRPPRAPLQRAEVHWPGADRASDALIGLYIGGAYVPWLALSWHQDLRLLPTNLTGRGPLLIPDIYATGRLTVALGPVIADMPKDLPLGVDIFTIPMFASRFPRIVVDAAGVVRF